MIQVKPETKRRKPKKIAASPPANSAEAMAPRSAVKYFPLTISVDEVLLGRIDKEWHAKGHRSRSETARDLLVRGLGK